MEVIADKVIDLLGSLAAKELKLLCNFQDDLETMKRKMTGIRALLRDAERKAKKSEAINDWLQKLKDTLLDAEDLLDAYSTEELAREVITKDKMAKEVHIFFSEYNRIVCAHKIGRKIKAIRMKLDDIYDEKNPSLLHERSWSTSNESNEWRRTEPYVTDQDVVGRDEERKHLVGTLLNPDEGNDVSVVPIVGIGGLGKTKLAQLVYKDVAAKNHFELMMWVCVSDESHALSNNMLAQKIIEQETNTNQACQDLRRKIEGKIFLLVLDDVWNIKNRGKWLELENLLRGGRKGSMIIVTTRSKEVADTMGTLPPLYLKDLDEDKSWMLFCRVAFRDGKEPENQELVDIGKDIVRRCSGVPLAIRTTGSLLFTKRLGVSEWSYFRDNELAKIDSDEDNEIFSILRLSYDHLPSHLKNCFAFCSLFPKDYLIERKMLIQLWIAEGFIIQPLNENMCLEDVGEEYVEQLLSRCLFQDVRRDDFGDIIQGCKMHDLLHDLARSMAKSECYIVTSEMMEEEEFGDGIRHVSSHFDRAWKFPFGNVKTKKVRTILSPKGYCKFIPTHSQSRCFHPATTSLPKHLRVLDLSHQGLKKISECIGDLKHLRYLDLTDNSLERLPHGITKLYNLLTLRLNECRSLIELPKYINRLVRLRRLELDGCDQLTCMPRGLGCLVNLQTLTIFVVDKQSGGNGARISELHDLIKLRGLNIVRLERHRSNVKEVESAKFLLHLPHLRELGLVWSSYVHEEFKEGDKDNDEIILEALEPPHTIKALTIERFNGKCLSEWIGSLTSLQELRFYNCNSLASLPESIGGLTSLQRLTVYRCSSMASLPQSIGSLTKLQMLSLDRCSGLASLPESIGSLTSLPTLSLNGCSALASLPESIGCLTSLPRLSLDECSALASLPESIGSLTTLQMLSLDRCYTLASLPESIGSLTSLQGLSLDGCYALASLPESIGSLTSLQRLSLNGCYALGSLPESIGSLASLQMLSLNECSPLASLPESIGGLTSLQMLSLTFCSTLASLPESIGSLTKLETLYLNGCSALASLPESIGSLTSLQMLSLYGCYALASLPESFGSLTSLQSLSFHGCFALASLPESIGSLTSLPRLSLNGCSALESLPESVGSLTSLPMLSLDGCSTLASLPESIGSLTSLQMLSLDGCSALASLPESIGSLTSLQMLSLDGCSTLASLPGSIGSLTLLQRLSFKGCFALASLPKSIGSLTSLQMLSLYGCSALASLPESIGSLTSLHMLSLNGCSALASLPESIGSLTSLHILSLDGCSALASLPESIGSLTSLHTLSLDGCSALASLPESIGSLTSLENLSLNGCSALASLPESIASLTSLRMLSLDE